MDFNELSACEKRQELYAAAKLAHQAYVSAEIEIGDREAYALGTLTGEYGETVSSEDFAEDADTLFPTEGNPKPIKK